MGLEMTNNIINIIIQVFFGSILITVCIPWSVIIFTRRYIVKKFSMSKAARILNLHSPPETGSSFSLADLQNTSNNSRVLSLYYYWLRFAEGSTLLFIFGTWFLLFFGFFPVILGHYSSRIALILIIIEIGITVLAQFLRYICEEIGDDVNVNLRQIW